MSRGNWRNPNGGTRNRNTNFRTFRPTTADFNHIFGNVTSPEQVQAQVDFVRQLGISICETIQNVNPSDPQSLQENYQQNSDAIGELHNKVVLYQQLLRQTYKAQQRTASGSSRFVRTGGGTGTSTSTGSSPTNPQEVVQAVQRINDPRQLHKLIQLASQRAEQLGRSSSVAAG